MALSVRQVLQFKGAVGVEKVSAQDPIADAMAQCSRHGFAMLVVVDEIGDPVGVVHHADMAARGVSVDRAAAVSTVMRRDFPSCRLDETTGAVMARLTAPDCGVLPVIAADTLVGVISRGDVRRAARRHRRAVAFSDQAAAAR